ncbi:hypothetical protein D3C72_2374040 [compost metagenome]
MVLGKVPQPFCYGRMGGCREEGAVLMRTGSSLESHCRKGSCVVGIILSCLPDRPGLPVRTDLGRLDPEDVLG